jgi:hypothetical protein
MVKSLVEHNNVVDLSLIIHVKDMLCARMVRVNGLRVMFSSGE